MIDSKYIGRFVTANQVDKIDPSQGWLFSAFEYPERVGNKNLFIIKGESGNLYVCEGEPKIVDNPPKRHW